MGHERADGSLALAHLVVPVLESFDTPVVLAAWLTDVAVVPFLSAAFPVEAEVVAAGVMVAPAGVVARGTGVVETDPEADLLDR